MVFMSVNNCCICPFVHVDQDLLSGGSSRSSGLCFICVKRDHDVF